jgi:hypothetical protein
MLLKVALNTITPNPITTNDIPAHDEMYSVQPDVIIFASDFGRHVQVISRYRGCSSFLHI